MGFDNNRGSDRPRRFSNNDGNRRPNSGGNSGRIENFEKPLIDLLKQISDKLDVLIEKTK
ncbi:hypothetical protein SCLARK_001414 [Spiroplasma clarkii]|uniref:Uncharacterized protein n=1 Tax=Spiroplasma clarkii TaxID=2139 RepID=A0A1Y0L2N1_9MOLU|nr:hypothetical protein [Spiroplasma clarkii]ARU91939.1 hypothetical protein SCLARK_001414 [Spiroplasma clarkii]ATX71281.1 hypothetical protein SCLAR_v1c09790 [Spiroplasma clarkii]